MKKITLQPEQIIVPYEYELGNESILNIYFRVFDRGHGEDIPPVLVARPSLSDRGFLLRHFADSTKEKFKKYFRTIDEMVDVFYLMDGNHKGIAAALCHAPIKAIELQNDDDLEELENMVKTGEYFNLPEFPFEYHEMGKVVGKLRSAVTYLEERQSLREMLTLRQRVNRLASEKDFPQYMKDRYIRKK